MLVIWVLVLVQIPPASVSTGATALWPGGEAQRSLTGAGVTIGLWDLGFPRATHEAFADGRVSTFGSASIDNHATGAAGAMIGLYVGQAWGADMEARVFSNEFSQDLAGIRTSVEAGLRLSVHPYEYQAGWRYNTSGWGGLAPSCAHPVVWAWTGTEPESMTRDLIFGRYHQRSADWDDIAYDNPRWLSVIAAGNQQGQGPVSQPVTHCRYDFAQSAWSESSSVRDLDAGITYMGVSKNVLTVGTWPNEPVSGRGPTEDGRIKPDLVAPATVIDTPASSADDAYGTLSQTSAASSVAGGAAALLLEHLRSVLPADPLASTLKALLIHTATDAGDTGPDVVYGWGILNIEKAVRYVDVAAVMEDDLADGGTWCYEVRHSGFGDLMATLVWTDPAGDPGGPALVNDLDLRIAGPGGPYLPLALNGGTSDNSVDNVEQVRLSGLGVGTYTVEVRHKGALASPQPFSLVVSSGDPQRRRFTLEQPGWRLVSVPFDGVNFGRLAESFIAQFGEADDPTLYRFSAPASYQPVTDRAALIQPGEGFLMYVFADDLPKNWVLVGDPHTERVERSMPWHHGDPDDSFLLAGNPFSGVLDWHAVVAASSGISNTMYVWDPSATAGGGQAGFRHHTAGNPGTGTTGRYIPAFSGFFTFAIEDGATLVLDPSHIVAGRQPSFHGKEPAPHPMVRVVGESGEAIVSFHPEADPGWDRFDVPALARLDGLEPLALIDLQGRRFSVMAMTPPKEPVRIRLSGPARITHADVDAAIIGQELVIGGSDQPAVTRLDGAYPNPFNPITQVRWQMAVGGTIRLAVHDILGREVAVLVDGVYPAGSHQTVFDGRNLASGVYVVRMWTPTGTHVRRVTLLK